MAVVATKVVAKSEVEVLFVVVPFVAVTFCNVVEPVTMRLALIEARETFGSNENLADEVEVPPIVTMSVLLRGALMNSPAT